MTPFQGARLSVATVRMTVVRIAVPLIPVAVWGSQRLWTYDDRSSLTQRGVPIEVWIGPPVDAAGGQHEATARLRRAVVALLDGARAHYPDDGTGQWWQPEDLGGTAPARPTTAVPAPERCPRPPCPQAVGPVAPCGGRLGAMSSDVHRAGQNAAARMTAD